MLSIEDYNSKEIELLARIMRAEAIGEGVFGMKLVGNVVVNRVVATCKPFKNKNTVNEVIFQKNAFEGTTAPLFNGRPNEQLKKIAKDCITFWRAEPAYSALYFYAPGKNNKCNVDIYEIQNLKNVIKTYEDANLKYIRFFLPYNEKINVVISIEEIFNILNYKQ